MRRLMFATVKVNVAASNILIAVKRTHLKIHVHSAAEEGFPPHSNGSINMSRFIIVVSAALLMTSGQALAEDGGFYNDPAVKGITGSRSVVIASDVLPVGSILPAGAHSYAKYGTHTYLIEPGTRRILRVLE